jgi:hypothetical protein
MDLGSGILKNPIPDPGSRIPDPGVKKAPDPGSGSATLLRITERKHSFKKFGPFSVLSMENWPKFGRSSIRPF